MEKLTFKNALGQEVVFSAESKYRWLRVDDMGAGAAPQQVVSSPFQDGTSAVGDAYFEPRVVKVDLAIISESISADIRSLNNILNPKVGIGSLTYEVDGAVRVLNKVKTRVLPSLPDGRSKGKTYQMTSIIFEAFDPLYTDPAYTSVQLATRANYFEFPIDITDGFEFDELEAGGVTITNTGDVPAPLLALFEGPLTAPLVLTKEETGEKITLALNILADERLEITSDDDNIDVRLRDTLSDTTISAFAYLDVANTDFFKLDVGDNTLTLTSDDPVVSIATVKFKNRYVGV